MPPAPTDPGGERSGELCAFQQRFEAMLGRLSVECEPIPAAQTVEKVRFVHAVMVMANSEGVPGERMKASRKAPLDTSAEEEAQKWAWHTQMVDAKWDPIGEAVNVLRTTTKMLEQMLDSWRGEEWRLDTDGREGTFWQNGQPMPSVLLKQEALDRSEGSPGDDNEQPLPNASSENGVKKRQPQHSLLSSKISFPSELRRYRMMGKQQEEHQEQMMERK